MASTDIVKYEDKLPEPVRIFEFSENNSGGSWWLNRKQYDALMAAGFYYEKPEGDSVFGINYDEPFLGSKSDNVPYGWRHNLRVKAVDIRDAVERWEAATGEDFFAEGCNCCGCPFSMSSVSEPYEYASGDSVSRETIRPW